MYYEIWLDLAFTGITAESVVKTRVAAEFGAAFDISGKRISQNKRFRF